MNKKKKRNIIIIISTIVLLLVLIVVISKDRQLGLEVTTEKAQIRDIQETVTAAGNIQAKTEVKISSEVSGEIIDIPVVEGQKVQKGQQLVVIRPDIYISARDRAEAALQTARANLEQAEAAMQQAKAQLINAELNYKRNKKLFDDKLLSESEFDNIRMNYEVARAQYESAKHSVEAARFNVKSAEASLKEATENLRKTTIYAPIDGVVTYVAKKTGERVVGTNMMDGTEIMRLADLSHLEVKVQVNENDIVRVNEGDSVVIEVDAYLGEKFYGKVNKVSQAGNTSNANLGATGAAQSINFDVIVAIDSNSYKKLITPENPYPFKPGMTASVEIFTEKVRNVWSVPIQAVVMREDTGKLKTGEMREAVFTVDKGKAHLIFVKTGLQDLYHIQIVEGINDSLEIITGPYDVLVKQLREGSVLKIKNERSEK